MIALTLCDGMTNTRHNILMRAASSLGEVALDVPLAEMLAELHQDASDDFLEVVTGLATGHDWYEVVPGQADFYGMLRGPIRGVYVPEEIAAGDPYIAGIDAIAMGYALRYGPESWKAYIREWLGSLTVAQWGELRAIWHHELECWVHELEILAHEEYPEYAGKEVQVRVVEHAKFRHDCAKALIAAGIDVNSVNKYGSTPLHFAAVEGHTECVKALIAAGAKLEAEDRMFGHTPLSRAQCNNRTAIVALLKAAGATK